MSSTTGTIQTQLLSSFTEHLNIKILTIFLKLFHSGLQSNELYFWASSRFAGYKEHFSGFFCLVFVFRICPIRSIGTLQAKIPEKAIFSHSSGTRKILRNSLNVRVYFRLNHRRIVYIQY